jgi:hypothetical protein
MKKTHMARSKKPLYRIGELVACYASVKREDNYTGPKKLVAGWIEKIESSREGHIYFVRWADRLEAQEDMMRVLEVQIGPLKNLVNQIRSGEVK